MDKPVFDLDAEFGNIAPEIKEDQKEPEIKEDPKEPEIKEDPKEPEIKEDPKLDLDEEIAKQFGFSPEEIKNKLQELENSPKLTSDFQKKLYTFVSELGEVADLGAATQEFMRVATADYSKMDDKEILREAFLLENNDMDPVLANKRFERQYEKKFVADDIDDQDDLDFERIQEAKKARKTLEEKQKALKPEFKAPKETETETKTPEVIVSAISSNKELVKKSINGFDGLVLKADDVAENNFKFALSKEQAKEIEARLLWSVDRPELYNEKGEFTPGFEAEASRDALVMAVYGEEILDAFGKHCLNIGYEKRTRELSGETPDRKGGSGAPKEPTTWDESWEAAAAKRRANKNK